MFIKVCGNTNEANLREVLSAEPDMLGFIFYKDSPRDVTGSPVLSLLPEIGEKQTTVGVFVDADVDYILRCAALYNLDKVQLHGLETPEMCMAIRKMGIQVIKALRIADPNDLALAKSYAGHVDYFLFDTKVDDTPGGTGKKFKWSILENYSLETPFILSGGIGPADVEGILQLHISTLAGIDINSRFETSPGIKDANAVHTFIKKLRDEY